MNAAVQTQTKWECPRCNRKFDTENGANRHIYDHVTTFDVGLPRRVEVAIT